MLVDVSAEPARQALRAQAFFFGHEQVWSACHLRGTAPVTQVRRVGRFGPLAAWQPTRAHIQQSTS